MQVHDMLHMYMHYYKSVNVANAPWSQVSYHVSELIMALLKFNHAVILAAINRQYISCY